VFVDTYTNYHFTKLYGDRPEAAQFVPGALFSALVDLHARNRRGEHFSRDQRGALFEATLHWEQEEAVSAAVNQAVAKIPQGELRTLMLKPVVRFEYFRLFDVFFFQDFSSTEERIKNATHAYEIAEDVGFQRVFESMRDYGGVPDAFFADPSGYTVALRARLLGASSP
jgi:hypothetical protein